MHRAALLVATCLAGAVASRQEDWLVTKVTDQATVTKSGADLVLSNGLLSRRFAMEPAFGTVDMVLNATLKHGGEQSLFRRVTTEAVVVLAGVAYPVGGLEQDSGFLAYCNRTSLVLKKGTGAFTYVNHTVSAPVAPFPWVPGTRHSPKTAWPPKGITLSVLFAPPPGAPNVHVTVHYQMVNGLPLIEKWLTVTSAGATTQVTHATVEFLAVMPRFGMYIGGSGPLMPGSDGEGSAENGQPLTLLHPKTDQAHVGQCNWESDWVNDKVNIPGCPSCRDEGAREPLLNCSYTLGPGAVVSPTESFESFKVYALVTDSAELERHTLSRHRLTQALAPHVMENPIFFHGTESSEEGFKAAVDQMAEVGFEMFIFSFGSGFNLESDDPTYLAKVKSQVDYAKAKGIEVGGYDLICLSKGGAVKPAWRAVGNEGSACFASGYYDYLHERATNFINKTGLAMLETDGPYAGQSCSSTSHAHHHNEADSVYKQTQLQNEFYKQMRALNIYVNQPDNYFFQGGSRTGMGYDEQQYSLPRWRDLSISRMGLYDDLYVHLPSQGWMFLPLTQYHAGGSAAIFENHNEEYEWGLAQYLGAGTAACYRGDKPYHNDEMKAILTKWISMYKAHRETLIQPIVHIRRPNMQGWDGWLHANPFSSTSEVGFAMFFNPTGSPLMATISVDLYYTGLTDTVAVSINDGASTTMRLARDYSVVVQIAMPAKSIHYVSFARN
eukprot:Rhum_TRINITY_DN14949_c0_g1::Rhum_TRINITY_DN14949_c0_g1_i1::g.128763::m.128763